MTLKIEDLSVFDKYDVLLVDVYGVLWDGKKAIKGTPETLKKLKEQGKTVIILSNTTALSSGAIKKFAGRGFVQGEQYHEYVTSGDVMRHSVEGETIKFDCCPEPVKYCQFGTPRKALFVESKYIEVDNLDEADFVYISIPQLTESQLKDVDSEYAPNIFESRLPKEGDSRAWDALDLEVFMPQIEEIAKRKLPVLNANPDLRAAEAPKATEKNPNPTPNFVIRQGSIAKKLEEMGLEVHQSGKPYVPVYNYVLNILRTKFKWSDKKISEAKMCMIGDTLETDILGAANATRALDVNIESVLTLSGVAANMTRDIVGNGEDVTSEKFLSTLEDICKRHNIVPNHVIKDLGAK